MGNLYVGHTTSHRPPAAHPPAPSAGGHAVPTALAAPPARHSTTLAGGGNFSRDPQHAMRRGGHVEHDHQSAKRSESSQHEPAFMQLAL
jgi:hypothetical protein